MAIKFQYNKTSLGDLGKQLKMQAEGRSLRIKSKESALRSEVKKAKEAAQEFRSQLSRLEAEYDYMVSLWGEFDCDLLRIADIELTEQKIAASARPCSGRSSTKRSPTTSSRRPYGTPPGSTC